MQLALVTQRRHQQAKANAVACTGPLPPRILEQLDEKKNAPSYSNITKFVKSAQFRRSQAGRVTVQVTHAHSHMFQCSAFRSVIIPANCSGRSPDVVAWTGWSSLPKGRPLRPADVVSPTWTIFRLVKAADHESPSRIRAQPTSPLSPNNSKCGCLLFAAEKAGIPPEKVLNELDTTEHWQRQYEQLSSFEVPSSALLCEVELDEAVKLHVPLAMPAQKGRPSSKRKDSAYNQGSAAARKKSAKNSRGATPGSSSAPMGGASEMGQKKGGRSSRKRKDDACNQGPAASKKSAKKSRAQKSRDATPGSSSAPSGASSEGVGRKTGRKTKAGGHDLEGVLQMTVGGDVSPPPNRNPPRRRRRIASDSDEEPDPEPTGQLSPPMGH